MAEHLLRHHATQRALPLEVSSCGLLRDGEAASKTVVEVMVERGIDVRGHRSRRFRPELADDVDLVVTMERFQAREVAVHSEGASERTHTLGGAAGWFRDAPAPAGPVAPSARLAALFAARSPVELMGVGPDEVADPHGRSRRVHRDAADRIEDLCVGLLDGLYGETPT